jgi:hypothetical protein
MTVSANGSIAPKIVRTGDLRGRLRVIRAGLEPYFPVSRGLHQVDDRQVISIIHPRSAVGGCASG